VWRRATRSSRCRCATSTRRSAHTCTARHRASSKELDEEEFYATFYCASVTRCYPGRAPSGRGDRTPTPREQELCAFWREWELEIVRPRLIVPVGGLAIKRLLGISGGLASCIGCRYEVNGAAVVPLPHPSGASSWLNLPANRELTARAADLVRGEVARLQG
jgi:uracil-DNA glycosylase